MQCNSCTKCDLSNYANNTYILGIGNERAKVMIVGDNPNYIEDKKGEYGHGNPQQLLEDLCKSSGIKYRDVYYTPVVKCRKPEKGKVSATHLKECKEYLLAEIEKIKPQYVITLGATALKALTNKAKITEIHGQIIEHKSGYKILPTFHPSMSLRDPRFWDRIHTDFRKFGKIVNNEPLTQHTLVHERITTKSGLEKVLRAIQRSRTIAFDLETNGLQMRLRTSQIGQTVIANYRCSYVVEHEYFTHKEMARFHKKCKRKLKGKNVIAQNGKFDNLWLYYMYGVRFPMTFDTMLASHLCDENSPNALKQNARSILDMDDWDVSTDIKKGIVVPNKTRTAELRRTLPKINRKSYPKEERDADLDKLIKKETEENKLKRAEYAAWDGYSTIRLYSHFKNELSKDPELESLFYELVMPVAIAYEQVEINGVHIDLENMEKAEKILKRKIKRLTRTLQRYIGPWREGADVNWNSGAFVNKVLFEWLDLKPAGFTEKGAPSTAEDNLVKMKNQHPIISTLLEYRGAFKQMSSFIEGWKKRMIDGQLFPSFKVAGTVTGRPSCSDPNLQQVPRDPFIRSLIGAPKGWSFFEVDYSQIELRVAAAIAGETTMLQVFRNGGDIHESTYQLIMGMSTQDAVAHIEDEGKKKAQLKEERKKAKAINFGFIYGMGWKKFREYCETKMGLIITDQESKAWRKRYFETYPGLIDWHNRQRRIVRAMGLVRTFTGRIRHLPQINSPDQGLAAEAERNAINAPVQGFGAEMILMALPEVNDYFGNDKLKLNGTVHDAMVGIVRNDVALEAMARVKAIMESPKIMKAFGIELPLPIIADVSLGNWGIAREYDAEELPEPMEIKHAA